MHCELGKKIDECSGRLTFKVMEVQLVNQS
jgi:hypothetical protein